MSAYTTTTQANQERQPAAQIATVKPVNSKVSRWLNGVVVVMILIAIPSAYYFGYSGVLYAL